MRAVSRFVVASLAPSWICACSSSGGSGAPEPDAAPQDASAQKDADATTGNNDGASTPPDSPTGDAEAGSTAFGDPCAGDGDCASTYCNPATSVCDALTLASGQYRAGAMAIDSANLYWSVADDAQVVGTVMKISLVPGSQPEALTSAPGTFIAMAVDEANVYFGGAAENVFVAPIDGGAYSTFFPNVLPGGIALDDASVYFPNYVDNAVWKALKSGDAATELVPPSLDGGEGAYEIAVDTTSVYWTNRISGNVYRVSLDGGGAALLAATGIVGASGIVVDSAHAYWGNERAIESVPLDGGSFATLTATPEGDQLALDAAYVYWTDGLTSVYKIPIGGGSPVVLASGQASPTGIAIDASYVYFANKDDGTIKRVHK